MGNQESMICSGRSPHLVFGEAKPAFIQKFITQGVQNMLSLCRSVCTWITR